MTPGPPEPVRDEQVAVGAATIDELLSDAFETVPGQKGDADLAARRLAAWCKSSSSGDWEQFSRRLDRDGHSFENVLGRLATVRLRPGAPLPRWAGDSGWIRAALRGIADPDAAASYPFEHLFSRLADTAETRLWASTDDRHLTRDARRCLRQLLTSALTELCAPAVYTQFSAHRGYADFVGEMSTGGSDRLLDEKPVLLRLIASLTRQWLDTSEEFVGRLNADADLLRASACKVVRIYGGLSDRHHGGRCVLGVEFDDGRRVMYKPKDLRLDAAWHALVERLNLEAPVDLRAPQVASCDGYGWAEFIDHSGCGNTGDVGRFFRRAGAWLALFHCFAAGDIHQENLIAAGDHPIPVDLETILQEELADARQVRPESQAHQAARALIANSVMAVGLLPAYGRNVDRGVYTVGGVASNWTGSPRPQWRELNSDAMRPELAAAAEPTTNLPHVDNEYAAFGDHVDDFVAGFRDYARFLQSYTRQPNHVGLFGSFENLGVRKVIRPTRFYYMLLDRLKDDRAMTDGPLWSAQADFLARLADWDDDDPSWLLQRAERTAIIDLNVPHFETPAAVQRAEARVRGLDEREIAWQVEVIRHAASALSDRPSEGLAVAEPSSSMPDDAIFATEADSVADEIARYAVRCGPSAAWIGLGWSADTDVAQLEVLGHDLYNGACGIALFLAAHARVTGDGSSAELAVAAVSRLRAELKSRGAGHLARLLGIGGGTGLGSVVYAFSVISSFLRNRELLEDAQLAAGLMSNDLIAADVALDVVSGSAGAILGLLRLHAETDAPEVLDTAVRCADHLLAHERIGEDGRRSWLGVGHDSRPLNGMSHGAAGFAYALASVAALTGREDFAAAAAECVAYERVNFDAERRDWRDFRVSEPHWRSQWCHGAVGIGLSRVGMAKRGPASEFTAEIDDALSGARRGWPGHVDTLCCGSLGSIEFAREAGKTFGRVDLKQLAAQRLAAVIESHSAAGDYRWNAGARRFNVGLFRGLAGVGYTCLREVDDSLPNVLILE